MSTPAAQIPQTFHAYNLVKPGGGFGSDNLKMVQISFPPVPQRGEVLVKIHAVALNYRDQLVSKNQFGLPTIPANLVPCSDSSGEIVALGPDVTSWSIGQRVCANFTLDRIEGDPTPENYRTSMGAHYTPGVLAEYRVFPAHSLVEIPSYLSWEEAATLPCAGLVAYNALLGQMPKPIKAEDTVLILGTGGVSTFALQIASATGATVIVTSSSDDKLETAKTLGAKHTVNYKKTPEWDEEVLKITNGRGVDHVVEVGGFGTLERSLKSIRMGGSIAIVGVIAQNVGSQSFSALSIVFKAATLRGQLIGSVAQFRDLTRLFTQHQIHPVIDKVFSFEEAPAAYAYMSTQQHVGKVVIRVARD